MLSENITICIRRKTMSKFSLSMAFNIMKRILGLFLVGLSLLSCVAPSVEEAIPEYGKAEVYYLKDPCWLNPFLRYVNMATFLRDEDRGQLYDSFYLTDRDSLRYISEHISKGVETRASMLDYWNPKIVVFLRSGERVDTLVTNTDVKDSLRFGSHSLQDSSLCLFLIESVCKHDDYWAHVAEMCFYNGNMQSMLSTDVDIIRLPLGDPWRFRYEEFRESWNSVYGNFHKKN